MPTGPRTARHRPRSGLYPKSWRGFCHNILPHRAVAGSNHPALLGAAIVGHRVSKLRGGDLVQQLAVVNEQLSEHERVSRRELVAIARCTEQRRYGF
jgi:hypothetical protein